MSRLAKKKYYTGLTSILFFSLLLITVISHADDELAGSKVKGDLSVMVLGSGGPVATAAARASASYLIFVDGMPKILMDAGGGAYQRLAASGVDVKDLDIVLLTHMHIDHTGDLSPIIKTMYFHNRTFNVINNTFPPGRTFPFRVFGPGANGVKFPAVLADANPETTQYPATSEYVDRNYAVNTGMERYLNIFTRAIGAGIFNYSATDISPDWKNFNPMTIVDQDGLVISAVGVNHGPVPAVAYRIEYKGKSIVYSGDTSSKGTNMISLSQNADLLIYDTALATDTPTNSASAIFYALHTTPSRIGTVANDAGVKKLVLSHITLQTEGKLGQLKKLIRAQGFTKKITMAKDLAVYNLGKDD